MRRREYVAGGMGLAAVLAGGAYVAFGGGSSQGESVTPVAVETIEAPGSPGGTMTVPTPGRATVIEIFEPFCRGCHDQFPKLAAAQEAVDAQFVSLVPQSSEFDASVIVEEWESLGGSWPVGIDPNDHFFYDTFHATAVPHVAVIDGSGTLVLSKSDVVPTRTVIEAVTEAQQA